MKPITIDISDMQKKPAPKKKVYIPKCWVCMDRGFLLFTRKKGKHEYEHIAHCVCSAGSKYAFYGPDAKEQPSEFYVPSIKEIVDTDTMAKENLHDFIEKYRYDVEVMEKLRERGVA